MRRRACTAVAFLCAWLPVPAFAAPALDGAELSWIWELPFIGMLLSIATGPLLFRKLWHDHYGKFALGWALMTLLPLAAFYGVEVSWRAFVHAMLAEYMSFIVLLFALYTVAGGILVTGDIRGRPLTNTAMLAIGTLMASVVGTTGAAMILIRPLIRANENRAHNVHVFVFFIILVANVGGALTPLGDPPLFVGFLRGVDFFWTAQHLWLQTLIVAGCVLAMFLAVDTWHARRQRELAKGEMPTRIVIRGGVNFILIFGIVTAILMSAAWKPGIAFDVFGTEVALQNLARDAFLVGIAIASLVLTPNEHRESNGFSWEPIREVAILFAGIFVAIIPVLAMLQAGPRGAFAGLLALITTPDGAPNEVAYFWLTGLLSAFLDNAPTYLVFFELAGGDAQTLMGPLAGTLAAISMGAVYMGALTYLGNAPNFMIYAIATERGIRMPSFFGYLFWASLILLPLFVLLTLLPIAPLPGRG
ncbi:MAG: sodium:proton antiporter [Pseudorhodoplanes sp.]|nr:sodium:proton antiporter [Pseudorhodoplanes sp.]